MKEGCHSSLSGCRPMIFRASRRHSYVSRRTKDRFAGGPTLIVRWTLDDLPGVLLELGVERPFLVASPRWSLDVPSVGRWSVVPSPEIDVPAEADSLLAIGGGSAIDPAQNASSQTGSPPLSAPATYSGAARTPAL